MTSWLNNKTIAALSMFIVAACDGGSGTAVCGDRVCDSSENANECFEDCGCGNGFANRGEECEGTDLGDGTCMDAVNRGGTLGCNADCTFDTTECTLASCGNGVVEDGEACDGDDVGGKTCSSIGYAAGDVGCTPDCALDVTRCCNDSCPTAGMANCVGNSVRACEQAASGCLAWEVTDCGAGVCETSGSTATCSCVDRCDTAGDTQCAGASIETCTDVGGCLDWVQTTNCGTNNQVCAAPPSGPTCVISASAEDCSDPFPLTAGDNLVAWTAVTADYLTTQPSCNTTTLEGPDIVMSYTAPDDGFVRFAMQKGANTRHVVVASAATCGTLAPELGCVSEYTATTIQGNLPVQAGTTYHFYLRDTNSGTLGIENPLRVRVEETLCSTITPTVTSLFPENGASVPDLTPVLTAQLPYPIDATAGVITITGNLGTNLTYDLSMGPSQVAVLNGGTTLTIDPGIVFPEDEMVTVTWTGLRDATCDALVSAPTWTFQVTGPPCTPGEDGMVGATMTRFPTGLASSPSEYYVAADNRPNGYVYVGGTSDLYRMPKAGGAAQNVYTAAALTGTHLGYDMLLDGDSIYTLESTTSSVTTGLLWQLSSDGGTTWPKNDYMTLPQPANDDLRGITSYKGRYYMTTDEASLGTEIWSVPANATTVPQAAVLEATIPVDIYCNGIALDDHYYYLACYSDDRIIRVDRVTKDVTLLSDAFYVNITKVALHAHDFDNDGSADALYYSGYDEEVDYICKPTASGPFWTGVLANFGTGTSNYGLGFDPVDNALWMFDDDTREFVKIE